MDLFRIFIATAVIHLCLLPGLVDSFTALNGVLVTKSSATSESIDIGAWLLRRTRNGGPSEEGGGGRSLLVFGTYAADFNAVEYAQRLKYYWPLLRDGQKLSRCALVLNCQPAAAAKLQTLTDLPDDIELWVDNTGRAGRAFGVERGWLPDNADVNPFLKLFGMLWGLGAWATLPAVIGGYIGNPFVPQPWITDALVVGIRQGRWPDNSLEFSPNDDDDQQRTVVSNKFDELPLVGSWPRRPLELATLRLQSMLGISLKHWSELAPDQEALDAGVLTQLGGCLVTDADGSTLFEWRDPGICAVANFEDILKKLS
jgi:AhpC/TSA antioxidant enzyme